MNKVYIVVDFDGTIVEHRFPDIGPPVPGAIECLKRFQDLGFLIILNTMRSDDGVRPKGMSKCLTEAVEYLKNNGINLYGINHNPDQDEWTDSSKTHGHFNIDDINVGCPLIYPKQIFPIDPPERPYVNWQLVEKEIMEKTVGGINKSH